MKRTYFTIEHIPDLTLVQYSSMDGGNVPGVVTAHSHFWRQLNRKGLLNNEAYHLIYEYDPSRPMGNRMKIGLAVDACEEQSSYIEEVMASSSLGPYYMLVPMNDEQETKNDKVSSSRFNVERHYAYGAHLYKAEMFLSSKDYGGNPYYITSVWEMNENGRLYTMMKLMEKVNQPCVYIVSIYPKDLTRELSASLDRTLYELRETIKPQVSRTGGNAAVNSKDEHAKNALDYYEDLLENLADNPHFLVDVQVISDDPQLASIILDAAASEALSAGNHQVMLFKQNLSMNEVNADHFYACASERAPTTLTRLPQIMLLDEVSHFAVFPVLYGGEWTEIPKETAPSPVTSGLSLGTDQMGHEIYFPVKNLSKHAFLAGVPGSGKTNAMMHLINEIHGKHGIPVLIFEPAKHEYRALTGLDGLQDISLFSPGASTHFPLHINPFQFPIGMTLAEHIRNLISVFDGAFSLEPPMPFLLDSSIQEVYEDCFWHYSMVNMGLLKYPTMGQLYNKLAAKLETTDYSDEVKGNLKSALQVRIGSLITREMADIFDVGESTIPPEDWLTRSAIIELERLGQDPANFTTLLIATLVRESLKTVDYVKPEDGHPRHVMFFEEAHNLIGPSAIPLPGEADPKTAATAYIVKMLAEVRALGESIVIADQLPTAMAPEIIKNTSLKIGLRITAQDDRELMGGTMSANPEQIEKWSTFIPGHGLISYEALLKPFEVQLPHFIAKEGEFSDKTVLMSIGTGVDYCHNMNRSLDIMRARWNQEIASISASFAEAKEALDNLQQDESGTPLTKNRKEIEILTQIRACRIRGIKLVLMSTAYYSTYYFMHDKAFYGSSLLQKEFENWNERLLEALQQTMKPLDEIVRYENSLRAKADKPKLSLEAFHTKTLLYRKMKKTWQELK